MRTSHACLVCLIFCVACSQISDRSRPEFLSYFPVDSLPDTSTYEPVPPVGSTGNAKLRNELGEIYYTDQEVRRLYTELQKPEVMDVEAAEKVRRAWRAIDSVNAVKVIAILDRYGWLGPLEIGEEGSTTLWLVIQHSEPEIQEKYLPKMRRAVRENRAKPSELAMLEDRVRMGHGRKQLFGSQLIRDSVTGRYRFYPTEDEIHVNRRRAAVGLPPIEEYAKFFGVDYSPPAR